MHDVEEEAKEEHVSSEDDFVPAEDRTMTINR